MLNSLFLLFILEILTYTDFAKNLLNTLTFFPYPSFIKLIGKTDRSALSSFKNEFVHIHCQQIYNLILYQ